MISFLNSIGDFLAENTNYDVLTPFLIVADAIGLFAFAFYLRGKLRRD